MTGTDGTVKVLLGRQWAQIERVEVTCREFSVWWEMSYGEADLTDDEADSIVEEFKKSIERRRKNENLQDG